MRRRKWKYVSDELSTVDLDFLVPDFMQIAQS